MDDREWFEALPLPNCSCGSCGYPANSPFHLETCEMRKMYERNCMVTHKYYREGWQAHAESLSGDGATRDSNELAKFRLMFYNAMNIAAMQGFPSVDECEVWLNNICDRAAQPASIENVALREIEKIITCTGEPEAISTEADILRLVRAALQRNGGRQ